jgi:hypothetical protein
MECTDKAKNDLIQELLENNISSEGLECLSRSVNPEDLGNIVQHIYDLNEKDILQMAALTGVMRFFDDAKNARRNELFTKKIKSGFRNSNEPRHKIVLAEGDSWFNYPIILTDVIDAVSMDPNLAVYSIARGGDWLLNMLTRRKYVEELSVLFPDFFLISAAGNDIVGASRLAAIVQTKPNPEEYDKNSWAKQIIQRAEKKRIPLDLADFNTGIGYLSKDFFALLMLFHLQYYFLMDGILNGGKTGKTKFPGIILITQGYDFPIPSLDKGFGPNIFKWYIPFIRLFLGHGTWLKIPLLRRGITDPQIQRCILYAMIYLFNEMMIDVGRAFNQQERRVFHIDSRNSVGLEGWADELHPKPRHFMNTGRVLQYCMRHHGDPMSSSYEQVYVVNDILSKLN